MATRVGKAGPSSRGKSRHARGKQEGKKINRNKKKMYCKETEEEGSCAAEAGTEERGRGSS